MSEITLILAPVGRDADVGSFRLTKRRHRFPTMPECVRTL
jgi:hypothetical protein